MSRELWSLRNEQPAVLVQLCALQDGFLSERALLADTGAGNQNEPVDMILSVADGQQFGEKLQGFVEAGGFISGKFMGLHICYCYFLAYFLATSHRHARPRRSVAHRLRWHRHFSFPQLLYIRKLPQPTQVWTGNALAHPYAAVLY